MGYVRLILIALLCVVPAVSPASAGPSTVEVTVEKHDFLINICKKYLEKPSSWRAVAKINRLPDPNHLMPGQKILIPVDLLKGTPLDGTVTFVTGPATFQPPGQPSYRPLQAGTVIPSGTELKTAAGSSLEVSYEDGTSFLLRENSCLIIKAASKNLGWYLRGLYLSGGKVISRIKAATGKGSRYRIRTPSAVAEARGTIFRVAVDELQTTRSEVLKGSIAVSTPAGAVSVTESEGTVVRLNELPSMPKKLLPPPQVRDLKPVYRDVPFRVSLNETPGATRQGIIISRDLDGKDVLVEKSAAPDEALEIDGLEDGNYTLRTFGLDEEGLEGTPSDAIQLTIRVNPVPPMIASPASGDSLRSSTVDLVWLKVRDAAKYHVQLAEDENFTTVLSEEPALEETRFRAASLHPGTYYFRVRSIADDGYAGKWSGVQLFTVLPPPPAPTTDKPEVTGNLLNLRWNPLGEAATYHVQVAPDEGFAGAMLVDETVATPAMTIPAPERPGTYFVRVQGVEKEGRAGQFSAPQSFTVERRFPFWSLGTLAIIPLLFLVF